jgi:hypothetical protein
VYVIFTLLSYVCLYFSAELIEITREACIAGIRVPHSLPHKLQIIHHWCTVAPYPANTRIKAFARYIQDQTSSSPAGKALMGDRFFQILVTIYRALSPPAYNFLMSHQFHQSCSALSTRVMRAAQFRRANPSVQLKWLKTVMNFPLPVTHEEQKQLFEAFMSSENSTARIAAQGEEEEKQEHRSPVLVDAHIMVWPRIWVPHNERLDPPPTPSSAHKVVDVDFREHDIHEEGGAKRFIDNLVSPGGVLDDAFDCWNAGKHTLFQCSAGLHG